MHPAEHQGGEERVIYLCLAQVDDDPRPYVAGLREFEVRNQTALADASRRHGGPGRRGIPYSTLMLNSINHPDARGMKLFADALMELFP